jgi:hypothetical protein
LFIFNGNHGNGNNALFLVIDMYFKRLCQAEFDIV